MDCAKRAADPVELLLQSEKGRMPELLPLRHGRMVRSAFTYYRGSALTMAADLARTPSTGARVQCCGDAHLYNFGGFGGVCSPLLPIPGSNLNNGVALKRLTTAPRRRNSVAVRGDSPSAMTGLVPLSFVYWAMPCEICWFEQRSATLFC